MIHSRSPASVYRSNVTRTGEMADASRARSHPFDLIDNDKQ